MDNISVRCHIDDNSLSEREQGIARSDVRGLVYPGTFQIDSDTYPAAKASYKARSQGGCGGAGLVEWRFYTFTLELPAGGAVKVNPRRPDRFLWGFFDGKFSFDGVPSWNWAFPMINELKVETDAAVPDKSGMRPYSTAFFNRALKSILCEDSSSYTAKCFDGNGLFYLQIVPTGQSPYIRSSYNISQNLLPASYIFSKDSAYLRYDNLVRETPVIIGLHMHEPKEDLTFSLENLI